MGLSYGTVVKTYTVFNKMKTNHLPELSIPSWPEDMAEWNESQKKNPPLNVVIGYDKKHDSGWENICFFTKNPSPELISEFKQLANEHIGNTMVCKPYFRNESIWCIGWI